MSSIINSTFRITGLATGLDTDKMVSDLMKVERVPLDKIKQKKQLAEWKQEAYREITTTLKNFKDDYFDVLSSSYMLTDSAFKKFDVTSSDSDYVTAEGLSTAAAGSHTVVIQQLATPDIAQSSSTITKDLEATPTSYSLSGKTIRVTLDGVTHELTLDNYTDLDDLINKTNTGLQDLIDTAFGSGKITVSNDSGQLKFEPTAGSGTSKIILTSGSTDDALSLLGFTSGDSNRITTSDTLEDLADSFQAGTLTFDSNDELVFTINDEEFTFSKTDTLSELMNTINNNTDANVTMSYDEVTDTISITAKQWGAGDNIRITNTGGNFFDVIGIDVSSPVTTEGQDAKATIDGELVTRSSNTFDVNGVRYTLHKVHDATNTDDTITLEQNVDDVYDAIVNFFEDYNDMIDTINSKLQEEYDRDYPPLTDEQKENMTEKQIEAWEEKAKTGLLRNDSILEDIVTDMRTAMMDDVESVDINLSIIGISAASYKDNGKYYIDETTLKTALRERPDEVKSLFIRQSTSVESYDRDLTSSERSTRYSEEGLLYRISDIIEDNISTYRDSDGNKGLLLEKAGYEGDTTEFTSLLYDEIEDYNTEIVELNKKLSQKEEQYYNQFAQLEKMIGQMNNQMSWLMAQLGTDQQS